MHFLKNSLEEKGVLASLPLFILGPESPVQRLTDASSASSQTSVISRVPHAKLVASKPDSRSKYLTQKGPGPVSSQAVKTGGDIEGETSARSMAAQ